MQPGIGSGRDAEKAGGLLVIGLLDEPFEDQIWIWDLLQRVRPQLYELLDSTGGGHPAPVFRKTMRRRFRLAPAAEGHPRVALVATAAAGQRIAHLTHWHITPGQRPSDPSPAALDAGGPRPAPAAVHQAAPASAARRLPPWPYWLDRLPPEGLDLLALPEQPAGREPSTATQLALASALLGLLWEIVRGGAGGRLRRAA